jgi:hypothetical protein
MHKPYDIGREFEDVVCIDGLWYAAIPVASLVRCNRMETGGCQCRELMAPRVPDLREAVT